MIMGTIPAGEQGLVFPARFWMGFSKQNGLGFTVFRAALKRHPCRFGLNSASMRCFPCFFQHSVKKILHPNSSRENQALPSRRKLVIIIPSRS